MRRGTAQDWIDSDPILASGEVGVELDTGKLKYGDGVSVWTVLNYFVPEPAVDSKITASMQSHLAAPDPHPVYLTPTEGNAAYEPKGTMAAHVAAADPHPIYLTAVEGTAAYEAKGTVAAHEAAANPHPGYLQPTEILQGANITVDTATTPGSVIISGAAAGGGSGIPIGMISAFGGTAAPEGWHLCDGTAHASDELRLVLIAGGFPNPDITPDLRDRFIAGAGMTYTPGATGGLDKVLLTAAESGVGSHLHTATSAGETQEHTHTNNPGSVATGTVSAWHTHSGTTASGGPTHTHDAATHEGITTGDSDTWIDSADDDTTSGDDWNTIANSNTAIGHTHTITTGNPNGNHTHAVDLPAYASGGRSAVHTHAITVAAAAAAASAAHENRPPFYALAYIIKK